MYSITQISRENLLITYLPILVLTKPAPRAEGEQTFIPSHATESFRASARVCPRRLRASSALRVSVLTSTRCALSATLIPPVEHQLLRAGLYPPHAALAAWLGSNRLCFPRVWFGTRAITCKYRIA